MGELHIVVRRKKTLKGPPEDVVELRLFRGRWENPKKPKEKEVTDEGREE